MRRAHGIRAAAWAAGWLGLGILALTTGSAAALAALIVAAVLPILSLGSALFARKKLTLQLKISPLGDRGQPLEGTLTVHNPVRLPIGVVLCQLQIENSLTGQVDQTVAVVPAAGSLPVQVPLQILSDHCGYVQVRIRRAAVCDVTGCFRLPLKTVPACKATILPQLLPCGTICFCQAVAASDADAWMENRKGNDPTETLQLREYVPGDSLKQIHWKLSSKTSQLLVRESSQPVLRSVLVFWDKTAAAATPAQMSAMADAFCSVCHGLCQQGIPYTVAWNDGTQILQEEIVQEDALLQHIPRFLKSGCHETDGSALQYLPEGYAAPYSHILYFCAAGQEIPETNLLAGLQAVTKFLCTEQPLACEGAEICYTPQTCEQMLQDLELEL